MSTCVSEMVVRSLASFGVGMGRRVADHPQNIRSGISHHGSRGPALQDVRARMPGAWAGGTHHALTTHGADWVSRWWAGASLSQTVHPTHQVLPASLSITSVIHRIQASKSSLHLRGDVGGGARLAASLDIRRAAPCSSASSCTQPRTSPAGRSGG